jgi:hypothetical protein
MNLLLQFVTSWLQMCRNCYKSNRLAKGGFMMFNSKGKILFVLFVLIAFTFSVPKGWAKPLKKTEMTSSSAYSVLFSCEEVQQKRKEACRNASLDKHSRALADSCRTYSVYEERACSCDAANSSDSLKETEVDSFCETSQEMMSKFCVSDFDATECQKWASKKDESCDCSLRRRVEVTYVNPTRSS